MREITDETFEPRCSGRAARRGRLLGALVRAVQGGRADPGRPRRREHAGRVEFVKLNIDENPVVASRYDVLAIPTAILFEGGEARETVVGARSRSHYEDAWATWLRPPPSRLCTPEGLGRDGSRPAPLPPRPAQRQPRVDEA